jgi:hypothetical protein
MTVEIDELCRRLQPVIGDRAQKLWALYQAESPEGRKWVELELKQLASRRLGLTFNRNPALLEPPPAEVCDGEYRLGSVVYNGEEKWPFGMREDEWIQHAGIFGRSGSGKTNTMFGIIGELVKKGKPFLVMDWKKNYRDLLPSIPGLLVFTVGRDVSPFWFNPLVPPPGTPAQTWLKKIIEIAASAYFLGEGVKFLLQNAMDEVYKDYGVYGGEVTAWPTMADVSAKLERSRPSGRQAEWMASTMRALSSMCFGEFGRVLNVRRPFPVDELLKRRAVLELDALTNTDKSFLIQSLLLWIHHFRMADQKREEFKHALVIEEAHHILLRKRQEMTGEESVTDIILREIRELGEAVILLDQHPSLISKPALGNTGTTICMNLKHADDVRAAADAMQLFGEDRKCLGEIPVGSGAVRLQGRWPRPFLVRFPHAGVRKGAVTDDGLRRMMEQAVLLNPLGVLESRMLAGMAGAFNAGVREAEALLDRKGRGGQAPEAAGGDTVEAGAQSVRGNGVAVGELAFLRDVALNPYEATHERYRRLGLTFYRGNKTRDALMESGLLRIEEIRKRDGRVKLFEPTSAGREILKENGISMSWRHGGVVHGYWVRHVADVLRRQGWTVEVEKPIGGGAAVDVAAEKDGVRMAVEVETGNSDAVHNVKRALEAGFDKVLFIVTNATAIEKLKRQVLVNNNVVIYKAGHFGYI